PAVPIVARVLAGNSVPRARNVSRSPPSVASRRAPTAGCGSTPSAATPAAASAPRTAGGGGDAGFSTTGVKPPPARPASGAGPFISTATQACGASILSQGLSRLGRRANVDRGEVRARLRGQGPVGGAREQTMVQARRLRRATAALGLERRREERVLLAKITR